MGSPAGRAFKVNWVMNRIQNAADQNKVVSLKKLSAMFSIENKSTPRTFAEIIQQLEDAGYVKIEEDNIFGKKVWEAEKIMRDVK